MYMFDRDAFMFAGLMCCLLFLAGVFGVALGIIPSERSPVAETRPATIPEKKRWPDDASFRGTPAEKPVKWDLSGTWNAWRYGTKEKPGKKGRWEAKWVLKEAHAAIDSEMVFKDQNGQGEFYIRRNTRGEGPWTGDLLVWAKPDGSWQAFSINEQSYGCLTMTGDDGEFYMAVRTDGP